MRGFKEMVEGLVIEDGGYKTVISEGWKQGRTAYGGLTTGLVVAATQKAFPDLPMLRSIQMNFTGPVSGDPVFIPTLLRQGKNVTTVRVDVKCENAYVGTSVLMFGVTRQSVLSETLAAPVALQPDDCAPFTPIAAEQFVPAFFLRFQTKLIDGNRPVSGAKEAYIRAWSRHVDENSRIGMASFLTIGDVLPPAALPTLKQFAPVSSMNWHMNILRSPETEDGWWHIETRQTAAQDGYSSQVMRFWNSKGDLVAEGIQSVAIFA